MHCSVPFRRLGELLGVRSNCSWPLSTSTTSKPLLATSIAIAMPAGPAPTTARSADSAEPLGSASAEVIKLLVSH